MSPRGRSLHFGEVDAWALEQGYGAVAGVDEAGRGAMAGPVVAAAVILPPGCRPDLVDDSKALSPPQRERAFDQVRSLARGWAVGMVEAALVDRLNVLRATHLAMRQALLGLEPGPDFALVDGYAVPGLPVPHRAIVDGDALSPSIGAASIVAKVVRDRIMERLDLLYPGYGLGAHKGYCSPEHRAALADLGPSPIHRRSFAPVAGLSEPRLLFEDPSDAR